ncbi:conserved hypothetical protein [Cupriavidus taiwanensis]|nr:conserved hypothetical protein [Cupriavidus taiwanensis]SOY91720.1 conserved hypothetical protein [Cupriavidus taiwanensis]
MAPERFNRESACRGIGENPRIKNRAVLPIARVAGMERQALRQRQSKKPEARLPAFLNSLVGRE